VIVGINILLFLFPHAKRSRSQN